MRVRIALAAMVFGGLFLSYVSYGPSQPSFNGTVAGCGGGSCHTFQAGIITVTPKANLQVSVAVPGVTANLAGELVDSTGAVVAVLDKTSSNPFTLTAPAPGRYTVMAGYKSPARRWDSVRVNLTLTNVSSGDPATVGGTYRLYQNYPNPFNPTTSIRYSVAHDSRVTLRIYNAIGQLVSTVADQQVAAGSHSAEVDMSVFPSGIYIYRIEATNPQSASPIFTQTRKMALVR
jgi:hypothetical protein